MTHPKSQIGSFRAAVMGDVALQDALSAADDEDTFITAARGIAAAHGLPFNDAEWRVLLRPDPLGLARPAVTPFESTWPPPHWLPVALTAASGTAVVEWAHFGTAPLREPFFAGDVRRAMRRPFNRLFGYRMTLADLVAGAARSDTLAPDGFIFHMSRCGSTLVTQMLAAADDTIAISEAAPIDAALALTAHWPDEAEADAALRAIVAALGRRRRGTERRYVIKLDCWHMLAWPRLRRAFPATPWVFLYRDPVEVLVSQMREPGSQMIADFIPPRFYGIDDALGRPGPEYSARVLKVICAAATDALTGGGGVAVNYRDLPDALFTAILPHFNAAIGGEDRAAMQAATRFDAKSPRLEFASDSSRKQREADTALRAIAAEHLGPVYRRLEALRLPAARPSGKGPRLAGTNPTGGD